MWIKVTKWQEEYPPPSYIFQETQTTFRLSVSLFLFDRLLQGSLSNIGEFCRNPLNKDGVFLGKNALLSKFRRKGKNIFVLVEKWYPIRAPPASDICSSQMPETEEIMYKRYFRKKDPSCKPERIEWIEMNGSEFYRFVNSTEGQGRYFIDMGDVVLEASESDFRNFKAEKNHRYYIQAQEENWTTLSLYAIEDKNGCSGEEAVRDNTQDVEAEAILRMERRALQVALYQLDEESRLLIYALYLADERKTERDIAQKLGVSQNAINKQKKKILQKLKFLVVKTEKSRQ